MKPPPLASGAHPGFIRLDGVKILLQRSSDRLHDRFPAIGNLTDAAHCRAGSQPNLPLIAKPCANLLDGKHWVTMHIDDAGDNLWPKLHRSRHFWGKGGLRLGVAVRTNFTVRSMNGDLKGTVRPIKSWAALSLRRGHLAQVSMAVLALLDRMLNPNIGMVQRPSWGAHMAAWASGFLPTPLPSRFRLPLANAVTGVWLRTVVAILVEWVFPRVDALTQQDRVVLSSSHQRRDGQRDGQDRFDAPRIEPLNLSLIHLSEIPVKSRSLKDWEFSRNDLRLRTLGCHDPFPSASQLRGRISQPFDLVQGGRLIFSMDLAAVLL